MSLVFPNAQTLFHSIGSDSDGNLGAWLTLVGSPTFGSNLFSLPAGALIQGGHDDWWDIDEEVRFKWVTGGTADIRAHCVDVNNWIRAYCDGVNIVIQKDVAGTLSGSLAQATATLTNNTFYWLRIRANGTLYTATVYNDVGGARGTEIAHTSFTITDPVLQVGPLALGAAGATILFGGAFVGVCTAVGPAPAGWVTSQGTGEPAWCWSKAKAFSGRYSLSVRNRASNAQAWWNIPNVVLGSGTYVITAQCWGLSGSAPAKFYPAVNFSGGQANAPTDSTWHAFSNTISQGAGSAPIELIAYGTGLYYYDLVAIAGIFADDFESAGAAGLGTSLSALGSVPTGWTQPTNRPAGGGV